MSDEGRCDGAGPTEPGRPGRPARSARPDAPGEPLRPDRLRRPVRPEGAGGAERPEGVGRSGPSARSEAAERSVRPEAAERSARSEAAGRFALPDAAELPEAAERSARSEGRLGTEPVRPQPPERPLRPEGDDGAGQGGSRLGVGAGRFAAAAAGMPWGSGSWPGGGAEPGPDGGRPYWLTGATTELLVTGRRVDLSDAGAADSAARLTRLLAAARPSGAPPLDPAREEAAVAAFRAARGSAEGPAVLIRRPGGRFRSPRSLRSLRSPRSTRRAIRLAVSAVASVIALSGVAVAVAAAGGSLPMPGQGSGSTVPAGRRVPTAVRPGLGEAGRVTASLPPVRPSRGSASPSALPGHGLPTWCDPLPTEGTGTAHCRTSVRDQQGDGNGASQDTSGDTSRGGRDERSGGTSKGHTGDGKGSDGGRSGHHTATWHSGGSDPYDGGTGDPGAVLPRSALGAIAPGGALTEQSPGGGLPSPNAAGF